MGVGVDVHGEEGVLTGSMGSSLGPDRSILMVDDGANTLLTGVRGTKVGCTLLRFRGTEASICVSSSVSAEKLLDWLVIFVA